MVYRVDTGRRRSRGRCSPAWPSAAGLDGDRQPGMGDALVRLARGRAVDRHLLYITVRYEPLTYEIAMLPLEGIIGSAILVLLVLEATRRTAGATLVGIILILIVYVFIGPHLPGDFAHPAGHAGAPARLSRSRRQRHDRAAARASRC